MKKILLLIVTLCAFSSVAYSNITWSTPATISTAAIDASEPAVVIDANNNVTAVWVENGVIQSSSLPSGGSWSSLVSLSNALNTASNPLLGIDSSGNVTALWVENGEIASATLPFGGSWSAETFPISGSGASDPALAVDASGNAVAVWVRSGYIESSTRKSGSWSLVSVLSVANSSSPDVAISSFGTAMAAWQSIISGSDYIISDILTISTNTWAATKVVNSAIAYQHNYPTVALDPFGDGIVAWFRYNFLDSDSYQNVEVAASSLTQGSNAWSLLPTILSNPGMRNPSDLTIKLLFDTSGDAICVWTNSYDGQTFSVESSLQPYGGAWFSFVDPQTPTLYSFGIDLAITKGISLLTNMAWDGVSNIIIQGQESDTTTPRFQAWTQTIQISTGNYNAYPQCAVSQTGSTLNTVAVWLYFDGSNIRIQAATGSETVVSPPTSVLATQSEINYGVYQDYYNTITWDASPDSNIIQYNIYRDGVFFGATDPSTLTWVDHNATNGGTVTYGIAALTNRFRLSVVATYTLNP